jgi:hypothetical protein
MGLFFIFSFLFKNHLSLVQKWVTPTLLPRISQNSLPLVFVPPLRSLTSHPPSTPPLLALIYKNNLSCVYLYDSDSNGEQYKRHPLLCVQPLSEDGHRKEGSRKDLELIGDLVGDGVQVG